MALWAICHIPSKGCIPLTPATRPPSWRALAAGVSALPPPPRPGGPRGTDRFRGLDAWRMWHLRGTDRKRTPQGHVSYQRKKAALQYKSTSNPSKLSSISMIRTNHTQLLLRTAIGHPLRKDPLRYVKILSNLGGWVRLSFPTPWTAPPFTTKTGSRIIIKTWQPFIPSSKWVSDSGPRTEAVGAPDRTHVDCNRLGPIVDGAIRLGPTKRGQHGLWTCCVRWFPGELRASGLWAIWNPNELNRRSDLQEMWSLFEAPKISEYQHGTEPLMSQQ